MKKQCIWFWLFCLMVIGAESFIQAAEERKDYLTAYRDIFLQKGILLREKPLGQGTYGRVYYCILREKPIALKVSRGEEDYRNVATREAEILTSLHSQEHTSDYIIKQLFHFMHQDRYFCIALEYMPGGDLYAYAKVYADKKIPLDKLKEILKQILLGLQYLRDHEVVHADLKPENVLVGMNGKMVKIADFGASFYIKDAEVRSLDWLQTRLYRCPEVLLYAAPYSYAIDMWSLGCMAVEFFIGAPLFPGKDTPDMRVRHMEVLKAYPMSLLAKSKLEPLCFMNLTDLPEWARREFKKNGERPLETIMKLPASDEFLHVCLCMLDLNPRSRITPYDALRRRFFAEKVEASAVAAEVTPSPLEIPEASSAPSAFNGLPVSREKGWQKSTMF